MIIKSMSRKAPTFVQLAAYIARGSDEQTGTKSPNRSFDLCAAKVGKEPNLVGLIILEGEC